MPKTAVGLFKSAALADDAVMRIEAIGLPRSDVRRLREPLEFPVTGVMSFPRVDFETDLGRELHRIGATISEAEVYVDGLRRGGALAFATGSDRDVEAAARIMNELGAVEIDKLAGSGPKTPEPHSDILPDLHDDSILAGRVRETGGGAAFFVW